MAKSKLTSKQKADIFYQNMTDSIVDAIENGATSWVKCWNGADLSEVPHNPVTGSTYKGMNTFWLWLVAGAKGYSDNRWGTFNNIRKLNGKGVRKGEKGTKVAFWKPIFKENDAGEMELVTFYVKEWTVFNYNQADDMPAADKGEKQTTGDLNSVAQAYIDGEKIEVTFGGNRACYSPSGDYIKMPHQSAFTSDSEFTSTLFHEIAHSTGHKSRLNRIDSTSFGSHAYSFEELVAEFTAVFMCAQLGILEQHDATFKNSAAYLRSWSKRLQDNPDWAPRAAQKAQKACERILSHSVEREEEVAA